MVQFTWNGSAWTSQGEVLYLYDGMLMVQERNAGNAPQVQYSRGVDLSGTIHGAGGIGGLLMRSHGLSGTNWTSHNAYHSDANGNVTALVNSSGVLVASYKYNPYGGLISSMGALASANRMRFSSKPAIQSATGAWGFYYYGYRFYDPVNQRWLNRDPIEELGGLILYNLVGNDMVNFLDSNGMVRWGQLAAGVLGIGGGVGLILLTPVLAPAAVVAAGIAGVTAVALGIANVVVGASEQGPQNIPKGVCGLTGYLADRACNPHIEQEEVGIGQQWAQYGDWAVGGVRVNLQWQHSQGWVGWIKEMLKK
jgi:RHS repeat-associated protein